MTAGIFALAQKREVLVSDGVTKLMADAALGVVGHRSRWRKDIDGERSVFIVE